MMGSGNGDINQAIENPSAFSDELDRGSNNFQGSASAHNQSNGNNGAPTGPSSKQMYLVELKEPLPSSAMSLSLNGMGPSSKNLEVVLYGHGCKNHIVAKMGKNFIRKTVHVDVTLYYYPINVSVKNGHEYTIYVPKVMGQ